MNEKSSVVFLSDKAGYVPVKRKVSCLFVFLFSFTNMNLQ